MKILLKNGSIVSGSGVRRADVLIENEKISKIASDITDPDAEENDLTGKFLFPGFIDAHTHMGLHVAGTVTADDFTTGTAAAIAGGTTTIIDFGTQYHGETLKQGLANWHRMASGENSCDYSFHMSISEWTPSVSDEIDDMMEAGITTFKLYMTYPAMMLNDGEIYEVLKKLKKVGSFAGVHCENAGLIDALIRENKSNGLLSPAAHPLSRPDTMEAEAVHRLMVIAKEADAPVMVVHTTNEKALKEIISARQQGTVAFCETCPQYLFLDRSLSIFRISEVHAMSVLRRCGQKKIRMFCGRQSATVSLIQFQRITAALLWRRKNSAVTILQRFRAGFRVWRRGET